MCGITVKETGKTYLSTSANARWGSPEELRSGEIYICFEDREGDDDGLTPGNQPLDYNDVIVMVRYVGF